MKQGKRYSRRSLTGTEKVIYYFLVFYLYSFIGWLWETAYLSLVEGHFVKRGFLELPFCTIYGFGVVFIYIIYNKLKGNMGLVFIASSISLTLMELATALVLDKCFDVRLWSYSSWPLNYNGYICLFVSIFWGLGAILLTQIVRPLTDKLLYRFLDNKGIAVSVGLTVSVGYNFIVNAIDLFK